jgi:hypothetical protein
MMFKLALILLASAVMATSVQGVIWPHIEGNSLETTQNSTGHDSTWNLPGHEGCIGRLLLWTSSGVFEYDFCIGHQRSYLTIYITVFVKQAR